MVDRATEVPGAPFTEMTPSSISRSSGDTSRASAAILSALARTTRAASATALPDITAPRDANVPTAYGIRRVSPVVTWTSSIRTPSSSATIWARIVWWPWPCVVRPVATLTRPLVSTCTCPPS